MAVRGGGGQNTITDCVILFIKSTGKNINFTGKTQGKHSEFKLEKGVGTRLVIYYSQSITITITFENIQSITITITF